jgi:hypothetical protein
MWMQGSLPTLLKQGAAPCLNFGIPCLNLGTLLKKLSTLLEIFCETRCFFQFGRLLKINLVALTTNRFKFAIKYLNFL